MCALSSLPAKHRALGAAHSVARSAFLDPWVQGSWQHRVPSASACALCTALQHCVPGCEQSLMGLLVMV